jgi:hypothetical protein
MVIYLYSILFGKSIEIYRRLGHLAPGSPPPVAFSPHRSYPRLQSTITLSKMDQIEQALADLRLQDKPNIQVMANKYNIDRTTLSRH